MFDWLGMAEESPALELEGRALEIRDISVRKFRERFPERLEPESKTWERLRGRPVSVEILTVCIGSVLDSLDAMRKVHDADLALIEHLGERLAALEERFPDDKTWKP